MCATPKGSLLPIVCVIAAMSAAGARGGAAQEESRFVPTNHTVISGYGTVGYFFGVPGANTNAFTGSVNPIFLFQFQDRWLFEAELEFEIEEGITETGLEYAQLDFILSNNMTLVGGKFLLPFGVFGDRLHPTWINKFPTAPPIYGHHVAAFGAEPLLGILSDMGVMVKGAVTPGPWHLGLSAYATQGPVGEDMGGEVEIEFPASSSDNNKDKMYGGRLDLALPPTAEVNVSYLTGDYDDQNILTFSAWNVAGELRVRDLELRGEYIRTRREFDSGAGFEHVVRHGFYAQAAFRWRNWEPVVRWTQIFATKEGGAVTEEGAWQLGLGLDYWFTPSLALMAGYEINREKEAQIENNRIVAHLAFGF